jgi:hypothetical protein
MIKIHKVMYGLILQNFIIHKYMEDKIVGIAKKKFFMVFMCSPGF